MTDPASERSKEAVGTGYRSRNPWAIQFSTQHFGLMPLTVIINMLFHKILKLLNRVNIENGKFIITVNFFFVHSV